MRDKRWAIAGMLAILLAELVIGSRFLHAPPFGDDNDEMAYVRGLSWTGAFQPDCYGLVRPVKNLIFLAVFRTAATRVTAWRAEDIAALVKGGK